MTTKSSAGTALITGASTGIGATYADRLARRGYDLILVARNEAKLETLAQRLSVDFKVVVHTLTADLTRDADLERVEAAARGNMRLTMLVNNAGTATLGPLAGADIDRLQREIALNILAPTRLAHAVLPGFIARKQGAIINIASVMSQMVQPGNSVYGGTKAYLLHFSQVLAQEVEPAGVRVQAVLPGATRTPIWDGSGVELASLPPEIVMEVGDMVDASLSGFDHGETVTIPALPDADDWKKLISARDALQPNLSRRQPAARYLS
jgi:short-subunit dehydrogenase